MGWLPFAAGGAVALAAADVSIKEPLTGRYLLGLALTLTGIYLIATRRGRPMNMRPLPGPIARSRTSYAL